MRKVTQLPSCKRLRKESKELEDIYAIEAHEALKSFVRQEDVAGD
jgi:hypothetical protein